MRVIHKFTIETRSEQITIPRFAEILSCINQREKICLYALVDKSYPYINRTVYCIGTGQEMKNELVQKVYFVDTVIMHNGDLIWHIFVDKEEI